ncbi:MAG: substrate-binding domain-containing protein, partial [Verrucomicrobiota bacterium]
PTSVNLTQRYMGFSDTITQAGGRCHSLELPGWTEKENLHIIRDDLLSHPAPTATFCVSDFFARMFYRVANDLKISIPDQHSIIGFSNNPLCTSISPELTSIEQHGIQIGKTAANMMVRLIKEQTHSTETILINTDLVRRESIRKI